jgi:tetratricopeptide (TPR) repeat protein
LREAQAKLTLQITFYQAFFAMLPLGFECFRRSSRQARSGNHQSRPRSQTLQGLAIATFLCLLTACAGSVDPKNPQSYVDRALLRIARGDQRGAIADFTQALTLTPQDAKILTLRGMAYTNQGKLQDAIKDFDQALSLNPKLPETLIQRGSVYNQLGEYQQALQDFDAAIALEQENGLAHGSRGVTLFQLGRRQEAIQALETAKAIFSKAGNQRNVAAIDKTLAEYRR